MHVLLKLSQYLCMFVLAAAMPALQSHCRQHIFCRRCMCHHHPAVGQRISIWHSDTAARLLLAFFATGLHGACFFSAVWNLVRLCPLSALHMSSKAIKSATCLLCYSDAILVSRSCPFLRHCHSCGSIVLSIGIGDNCWFVTVFNLLLFFAVPSCPTQVVKASDVLFLFGGAAAVRDTLKSVKDDLKGHQIIVPVTKDGDIDNFQVLWSMKSRHAMLSRRVFCVCLLHLSNV